MQKRWIVIGGAVAAVIVALLVLLGARKDSKGSTKRGATSGADAGARRGGGGGSVDDLGAAIDGKVLDERGGAIAGAMVRAAPSSRLGGGEDAEAPTARTGPDGTFTLAVAPGHWTVTAGAAGRVPAEAAVSVSSGQRGSVELRLEPGGAPLSGLVIDATGGPVGGAVVVLAPEQGVLAADLRRAVAVTTDDTGHFEVGVVPGRWRATTTHPEYVRDQRALEVGAGGTRVEIALVPGGVIEGVVRERDTGAPVGEARVSYRREVVSAGPLGGGAATGRERGVVTCGADGTFRIAGLGTGRILLDAETDDDRASDEPTEVLLGIAESAADVEVFVSAALSIRGTVTYDDGTPAAGAQVNVEQRGEARGVTADADGKFHVGGLRAGRYLAIAEAEDSTPSAPVPVELTDAPATSVELTVTRGAFVVGRVEPAGLAEVSVIRSDDGAVMMGAGMMRLELGGPVTRSAADGTFRIGPFAPGDLKLGARAPDGRRGEVSVKVDAKGVDGVVIALEARGRIAGRVVSGAGKPVPGAVVNLRRVTPGASRTTIVNGVDVGADRAPVDGDGKFAVAGLDAGTWKLTVLDARGAPMAFDKKGAPDEPVEVALAEREQKDGVELVVEVEDGVIRGVVLGPDGAPAADAWVTVRPEVTSLPGVGPIAPRGGPRPPPPPPPDDEAPEDGERVEGSMMITMIDDSGPQAGEIPPVLTDDAGRFEITGLRRGSYHVSAEGLRGAARGQIAGIATGTDCTVRLANLSVLRGAVTMAGKPVPDYEVSVEGPIRKQRQVHDDAGEFALRGLDPGDYEVTARTRVGVGHATATIVAGQEARVTIEIVADGTITGKLVDTAGAPLADHMIVVGPRMSAGEMSISLDSEPPVTAPDGTFTASAPAGSKTLFVLGPRGPVARLDLDITTGAATNIGTLTSGTGLQ